MNEIKIRFHDDDKSYYREFWEVYSEEKQKQPSFLIRDTSGPGGSWLIASGEFNEPSFEVSDEVTLILCDHNWNEQARTGNDRTRFPEFFPTLTDTCREAWNNYLLKPQRILDTPDFRAWLSERMPAGLNIVEQDNWLDNSHKFVKREVLMPFDFCGEHLAIIRRTMCHTHCGLQWREYYADTVDEADSANYADFYGYQIGNYVIDTNPLQIANLPYHVQAGGTQLTITPQDIEQFNALIGRRGKAPFRSRDPKIRHLVSVLKEQAARQNKDLTPSIDKNYYCETCGSRSGKCHPTTGYCFICDTDNWKSLD